MDLKVTLPFLWTTWLMDQKIINIHNCSRNVNLVVQRTDVSCDASCRLISAIWIDKYKNITI